jgi:hypothetical protein
MKKELPVNYIQHLTGFFELIAKDNRLTASHISLYMALFQFWNLNRFQNPVSIGRNEMMLISKIGSTNTYTKCLRELDKYNYIQYQPSFNPLKGSTVNLLNFDKGTSKGCDKGSGHSTDKGCDNGTDKGSERLVRPSINNIKHNKQINNNTRVRAKKISPTPSKAKKNDNLFSKPHLEEIQKYFLEKQSTSIDAERFFNHFESNGWLVGGKTKMKDWKAAARNWMLNTKRYEKADNKSNLHTNENKRYDIPL